MRTKLILLSLLLSSCSYVSVPLLAPYKMDIRQGNYVTAEMREKLRVGMTRSQVRYVLGTPIISDAFHGNRWDYAYRLSQSGELVEQQHLTLFFNGDILARIEEGGKPAQLEQPAVMPEAAKTAPAVAAPAQPDLASVIIDSVHAWAAAWSSKNVGSYLAAYAPDFKPQDMSREAWETQRLDRVSRYKVIEVTLSDIRVVMQDERHATATFSQDYRADSFRDNSQKTLKLEKVGKAWLIVSEQTAK